MIGKEPILYIRRQVKYATVNVFNNQGMYTCFRVEVKILIHTGIISFKLLYRFLSEQPRLFLIALLLLLSGIRSFQENFFD